MAAYALEGVKWKTQSVTWSFATTVGKFFSFDFRISEAEYQQNVRDAFAAWDAVAGIDFLEVVDSPVSNIRLGWDYIDGPSDTVGQARYEYFSSPSTFSSLSAAEIRFDTSETWSSNKSHQGTATNLYAVALHEIGHAIGLDHSSDLQSIMYAFTGRAIDLTATDIEGAVFLYGAVAVNLDPKWINGTAANDVLHGTTGNDRLVGFGGDDQLFGGAGLDTAKFFGARQDYLISFDGRTVADTSPGRDGVDVLIDIERAAFLNDNLAFDIEGNAGQAYRLYQCAFDRIPDIGGLSFWIAQKDAGVDLRSIAVGFIGSAEFRGLYGANPGPADFTRLIYQNVLNRDPDVAGYSYWSEALNSGQSRAEMLIGFSESAENQANVIGLISNGIIYEDWIA